MGLDRVVILLINSSDMSAAVAAATTPRSPTKLWAGPPTGIPAHTSVGDLSVWRPLRALAYTLLEQIHETSRLYTFTVMQKKATTSMELNQPIVVD